MKRSSLYEQPASANTSRPPLHWSRPISCWVSRILWEGLTGIIYPFRRRSNAQIRPRWQQIKAIETSNENVQKQKLLGSTNKCFHSVCFRVSFEEAGTLFKKDLQC